MSHEPYSAYQAAWLDGFEAGVRRVAHRAVAGLLLGIIVGVSCTLSVQWWLS